MSEISRRDFVKTTATAAAAGLVLATGLDLHASALGLPIGCQTWPVRDMIAKDFPDTIKTLVQAGIQTVEICPPAGYADFGFARLCKYKGRERKKNLKHVRVTFVSS